jgi:ActD protein
MAASHFVCVFSRQEDLLGAAGASREHGISIVDAYAPYPVHGLAAALGLRPSRLPWVCFLLGAFGGAAMLAFQHWASAVDWPINVGGRPWNSFPAFVPIAFEVIVLVAAVGTVAAFIAVAGLRPWRVEQIPDPRVTDDRFALVVNAGSPDERTRIEELVARFRPVSIEERMP